LVLTENGFGKRTLLSEYKKQGRGGTGVKTAKITSKTGELVKIEIIENQEDLIVISQKVKLLELNWRTCLSWAETLKELEL